MLETEELEFKSSPYQVELDIAKMELAKDVCALANGSGGVIIIGPEAFLIVHMAAERIDLLLVWKWDTI